MIRIRDDEKSNNSRFDNYTMEIKTGGNSNDAKPRKIISSIKQTTVLSQANDYFNAAETTATTGGVAQGSDYQQERRHLSPLVHTTKGGGANVAGQRRQTLLVNTTSHSSAKP